MVKGSYTVEAVFLFPIIVFLMAFLLRVSIGWYENIFETAQHTETLLELNTKEMFLNAVKIRELKDLLMQ